MPRPAPRKRIIKKAVIKPKDGRRTTSRKDVPARAEVIRTQARREDVAPRDVGAKPGLYRCTNCSAIYHDKHWHSAALLLMPGSPLMHAEFADALCEECTLEKNRASRAIPHSGEVVIEGTFTPTEHYDLLNLVRNVGHRAMARDPEDRIIRIEEQDGRIHIYTSENQLAVSIGKQVDHSHKGGELEITWSKTDKPVRVVWTKGAR